MPGANTSPWDDANVDDNVDWSALRAQAEGPADPEPDWDDLHARLNGRPHPGLHRHPEPQPVQRASTVGSVAPALGFAQQPPSLYEDDSIEESFTPRSRAWHGWVLVSAAVLAGGFVLTAFASYFAAEAERQARIERLIPEMRRAAEQRERDEARAAAERRAALESQTRQAQAETPSSSTVAALLLQNAQHSVQKARPGPAPAMRGRSHKRGSAIWVDAPAEAQPSAPIAQYVTHPILREPAAREPAVREPAVREPGFREPAVREPGFREPAVREPAVRAPAASDDNGNPSDDPLFGL